MPNAASLDDHAIIHPAGRPYTRGELIADRSIHIAGLVLAAIGLPILLVTHLDINSPSLLITLPLYALGVVTMLTCSLLYNANWGARWKRFLLRFDHAGILIMIAGTYGPFTLLKIGGLWGIGLFTTVWTLAIGGVILAFTLPQLMERGMVVLSLAMGWCIVVAIDPLIKSVTVPVLTLIVVGGLLYSVGVIFLLAKRLLYHNAIWHGFVVTAAVTHFSAIALAIGQ